jgi:catechol 2,3-dioxygenase-like lactoylglutathione lyase family enzyme
MNPTKLFPLVITDKLAETKAFYADTLGCDLVFDTGGYLQVRFGSDAAAPELAFMGPDAAPALGPQRVFAGQGLVISVPTPSADEKHAALKRAKVKIAAPPSDKPWGWRSFVTVDPNGVALDFFHVIAQSAVADATG